MITIDENTIRLIKAIDFSGLLERAVAQMKRVSKNTAKITKARSILHAYSLHSLNNSD